MTTTIQKLIKSPDWRCFSAPQPHNGRHNRLTRCNSNKTTTIPPCKTALFTAFQNNELAAHFSNWIRTQ